MAKVSPSTLLPCASVLKPVYVAIAGQSDSAAGRLAITHSSNEVTDQIIADFGGLERMAEVLSSRIGRLDFDPERAPTWGRFLVSDEQIVSLYQEFVVGDEPVLSAMRDVAGRQRFGVPPGIPVKAGWDIWPQALRTDRIFTRLVVVQDGQATAMSLADPIQHLDRVSLEQFGAVGIQNPGSYPVPPIQIRSTS